MINKSSSNRTCCLTNWGQQDWGLSPLCSSTSIPSSKFLQHSDTHVQHSPFFVFTPMFVLLFQKFNCARIQTEATPACTASSAPAAFLLLWQGEASSRHWPPTKATPNTGCAASPQAAAPKRAVLCNRLKAGQQQKYQRQRNQGACFLGH